MNRKLAGSHPVLLAAGFLIAWLTSGQAIAATSSNEAASGIAARLNNGLEPYPLEDVAVLRSGAELRGNVEEFEQDRQRFFRITMADGTQIELPRHQVNNVRRPSPQQQEYAQRRASMADTVEAHWEMQQWCLDNRLMREREFHLHSIIRLETHHQQARALLGYVLRENRWIHQDHFFASQGFVKDNRGRWRLPQGLELSAQRDENTQAEAQWTREINRLLTLHRRGRDSEALNRIREIRDPAAIPGLKRVLDSERDRNLRLMIVDVLGEMPNAVSQPTLISLALYDDDDRVRERAILLLKQPQYDRVRTVRSLRPLMQPSPATPNLHVQRAAFLLGQLEDDSAVRMLISGLRTTHTQANPAHRPGNMNPSFGTDGSHGLTVGQTASHVLVTIDNETALAALRKFTGQDFGYDQQRWLDWYIRNRTLTDIDLRRSE